MRIVGSMKTKSAVAQPHSRRIVGQLAIVEKIARPGVFSAFGATIHHRGSHAHAL